MIVDCLTFSWKRLERGLLQSRLSLDAEPGEAPRGDGPLAHVVRMSDADRITAGGARVIDRGSKHPAKPLSRYLIPKARAGWRSQMPMVRAAYRSSRQLRRSLRALLRAAAERSGGAACVVGVPDALFAGLWAEAYAGGARDPGAARITSAARPEGGEPDADLLELLGADAPDAELEQAYVGSSLRIRLVRPLTMRAARNSDPVLIVGESGTGKEIVARSIHRLSDRRYGAFVPLNCAAIPRELLESELFGHKRGAFAQAFFDRGGLWQAADRGTLFLDEVGDLAAEHQAKILRSLQEGEIRPVGSDRVIRVDARIIAASNQDLGSLVQKKQFREALYYRLCWFRIQTPALRECRDDIPAIAEHLWRRIAGDPDAGLSAEVLSFLQREPWPGNARGLKAVLKSLCNLFGPRDVGVRHVRAVMHQQRATAGREAGPGADGQTLRIERLHHLGKVLDVVRAVRASLRGLKAPPSAGACADGRLAESLQQWTDELKILALRPEAFPGRDALAAVDALLEGLSRLSGLLQRDPAAAARFWRRHLSAQVRRATGLLTREASQLAGQV